MENVGNISADEVITQLKDEGDFDRLRLKIIRKLKENEELRNNIIAAVKQSAAINNLGAEKLKPRQLSDAIHEEIGIEVMGQISDGVWEIIRSSSGMKDEIRETVESVYNKLSNPKVEEVNELSSINNNLERHSEDPKNNSVTISASEREDNLHERELQDPPGFTTSNQQPSNDKVEDQEEKQLPTPHENGAIQKIKEEPCWEQDFSSSNNSPDAPPGFTTIIDNKQVIYCSDEDPDVPPGFG